jgi:hypothetical protein
MAVDGWAARIACNDSDGMDRPSAWTTASRRIPWCPIAGTSLLSASRISSKLCWKNAKDGSRAERGFYHLSRVSPPTCPCNIDNNPRSCRPPCPAGMSSCARVPISAVPVDTDRCIKTLRPALTAEGTGMGPSLRLIRLQQPPRGGFGEITNGHLALRGRPGWFEG